MVNILREMGSAAGVRPLKIIFFVVYSNQITQIIKFLLQKCWKNFSCRQPAEFAQDGIGFPKYLYISVFRHNIKTQKMDT